MALQGHPRWLILAPIESPYEQEAKITIKESLGAGKHAASCGFLATSRLFII